MFVKHCCHRHTRLPALRWKPSANLTTKSWAALGMCVRHADPGRPAGYITDALGALHGQGQATKGHGCIDGGFCDGASGNKKKILQERRVNSEHLGFGTGLGSQVI